MEFVPEFSFGNLLTLVAVVAAIVVGWAKMQAQTERNTRDIEQAKQEGRQAVADLEKRREDVARQLRDEMQREIADVERELRDEKATLHARIGKHSDDLADAIKGLTIEVRAMHTENHSFRERSAEKFAGIDEARREIAAMSNRLDKFLAATMREGVS